MRWVVLLLLVACGNRGATELEAVKREVCACESRACADEAMKKVPKAEGQPSHREESIARDIVDCYAKLPDTSAKPVDLPQ